MKIKASLGSSVESAVGNIANELRGANLLGVSDFIWDDFNPLPLSCSGTMTISTQSVNQARFLQVGKLVHIAIRIAAITTATAGATTIYFNAPITAHPLYTAIASFSGFGVDGGNTIALYGFLYNEKTIGVNRYDGANWGVGATRSFTLSGFYEAYK